MMTYSLIGYALASGIILTLGFLGYSFLLGFKVKPSINRAVILIIYGIALIVPLIWDHINFSWSTDPGIMTNTSQGSTSDVGAVDFNLTLRYKVISFLDKLYLIGAVFMSIITIISIFRLIILKNKSEKIYFEGIKVFIHSDKKLSSFSWFNHVFIYEETLDLDRKMLFEHEVAHIRNYHWCDLIISQLMIIFQWFNPIAFLMRKELQQVHEYQADESVLSKGYEEESYQMLLLNTIFRNKRFDLIDGFNTCSIKKRIIMMNQENFKRHWILRVSTIIIIAFLGGLIFQIPVVADVISSPAEESEKENLVVVKKENVGDVKLFINGSEVPYDEIHKLNPDNIESITVKKNPDIIKIQLKNATVNQTDTITNINNLKVISVGSFPKEDILQKITNFSQEF